MANSGYVYSQTFKFRYGYKHTQSNCPQVKQPKCPKVKKINPKPEFKTLRYRQLKVYNIKKNFCKCIDSTGKITFTNMSYLKEQVGNCTKTELDLTETPCD